MSKKLTKEEFIKKAIEKHGDKYNYTKVDYKDNKTKVCIICKKHGEFWQIPNSHTNGNGCPKCKGEATGKRCRLSKEEFIKNANKVHRGKYNYDKVEYNGAHTKVCIICPEHGEFWQKPNDHTNGHGCPKCKGDKTRERQTLSKEDFIKKAREVHGDKYDYSKVNYDSCETNVCIICPKHGGFKQRPADHTQGVGCPKCANEDNGNRKRLSKEDFIKKANEKHGNKYDYSKVEYVDAHTKICIICPEHGEFWQRPADHIKGQGCPKCRNEATGERCRLSKEEFIKKANEIHKGKYNYDKVEYKNRMTKVCIICLDHGEFKQTPNDHIQGCGCPKCNLSHLERDVMNYLDEVGITYDYQKRFDWLGRQSLDFYLPDYNVGIECQGEQHFFPVDFAGKGIELACKKFNKTIYTDKRKKKLCEENGVKLLYYGNTPNYDTFLGETVHDDVQYLINYLNNDK